MQAKLEAAVARLEPGPRGPRRRPRQDRRPAERRSARSSSPNYQTGDPSLMGLSMVLTTQDPAELTGQLNSVQNVIDKESVVLDRLEASRALLTVQEQEVEDAKVEVAKERKAAAENLRTQAGARGSRPRPPRPQVAQPGRPACRRAAGGRARPRQADLAQLHGLQKERNRIAGDPQASAPTRPVAGRWPRPAAPGSRGPILADGGPVHSNGFLDYPVSGR